MGAVLASVRCGGSSHRDHPLGWQQPARALVEGGGEAAFPGPRDASRLHVHLQSRLGLHTPRHDGRIRAASNHGPELIFDQETRRLYWMARSVGHWLATRTTCNGATGAQETLIQTGQSRSLAKNVPCIPHSYDRLPEYAAAAVRQEYPCPSEALSPIQLCSKKFPLLSSLANSQKPRNIDVLAMKARRLLLSTDVGSHQATTQARVDGNESDKIYYAHGKRIDVIDLKGKNKKTLVSGEQQCRLGGICVLAG
ncbi:uncharacterized protein LOC6591065 [Drosophila persimilis]|uniref:uncharacterized protein LOC6591065 n=1 Tax=Drosophila persimilis TaxID=7234 RepID=UPI000F07B97D|nr:uncharacterized protein LOC6591065 [Drosophila persimilis]